MGRRFDVVFTNSKFSIQLIITRKWVVSNDFYKDWLCDNIGERRTKPIRRRHIDEKGRKKPPFFIRSILFLFFRCGHGAFIWLFILFIFRIGRTVRIRGIVVIFFVAAVEFSRFFRFIIVDDYTEQIGFCKL